MNEVVAFDCCLQELQAAIRELADDVLMVSKLPTRLA
jgi:hypothetical protein